MKKVGIGTRVLNCIVDILLVTILAYIGYKISTFYAFYYRRYFIPFYYFFFGMWFVYYFLFEAISRRTPGKWLTMTKVVDRKGGRPSIGQIAIRSLVRLTLIDAFFLPFLDNTLHDYLSKTDVVEI